MAAIFCFTSTGNSLFTAKQLADRMNGRVIPMNQGPVQVEDDVIGFVFPVYFWGLPRMVERFVSELQITNKNAYIFAAVTCGGTNFGVLGRLKKLLKAKGAELSYGKSIVSVSNYIPEYTPKDSPELRQKIEAGIIEIADAVSNRKTNWVLSSTPANSLAYRLYPDEASDRDFTVDSACTGCGLCKQLCPAKNITLKSGKPDFMHHCEHCLACVHHCPVHAIDWKQKTQNKDRYRNSAISLSELLQFNAGEGSGLKKSPIR